jgi:uncharacterized membrane protein
MIPTRHAVLLSLVVHLCSIGATHAEANRKQFARWSASCAGDAYCTASTRVSGPGGKAYAYQLRVSRYRSGAQEIAFLPAAAAPAADSPLVVAIDGETRFTLEPGRGYRRAGGGTTLVVEEATSEAMLRAMRAARKVTFRFGTAAGKRAEAVFPLNGFVQASKFAGIHTAEPAVAQATVPAMPEVARAGPGQQAAPSEPAPATARASASTAVAAAPARPSSPPPPAVPEVVTTPAAALPPPRLDSVQPVAQNTAGRKRVKAVQQFACRGNEPSWSLVIDHDSARFLSLTGSEPEAINLTGKLRVTGEGRTPDVDWRGKAPGGGEYKVLIQEQACSDTMADASAGDGASAFPYRARLTLPGGKVVQGCCNAGLETAIKREPQAPADIEQAPVANLYTRRPDDWSRFLLELMPAVDACLARTPGEAPYVTKAWPMNRGLVGVRTRNAVAGWFDCVAPFDGHNIERFEAVTADAGPIPGEGHVLFTPAGQSPLAGGCWRHERVVDLSGKVLGWLSSNGC